MTEQVPEQGEAIDLEVGYETEGMLTTLTVTLGGATMIVQMDWAAEGDQAQQLEIIHASLPQAMAAVLAQIATDDDEEGGPDA